ncbi:MAG TPA: HAD family hydrolase [Firmicutes bacterium]|nr:HAD family hydrolase [Bacillota bacterium]
MRYKAVFFDRDGTLTENDPAWEALRREKLREWSGRPFDGSDAYFMRVFQKVLDGGFPFAPYKTEEQELAFFRQWYLYVFDDMGITQKRDERADFLVQHLWYTKKRVYPEVREVLEYFHGEGYRLGVISDSPPSLERTLQSCGLAQYFTSFTASSLVGAGKPSPVIFEAALRAQGVTAQESLYVDDCRPEADGARKQGFTSFWLNREGKAGPPFMINSLEQLCEFVQQA